ncbi:MAG: hypothetical protein C4525_11675 [Desulfarculus sp.]|nr:MAG: hypothetical protein C4525_11675 [Desulfarculus sp.]
MDAASTQTAPPADSRLRATDARPGRLGRRLLLCLALAALLRLFLGGGLFWASGQPSPELALQAVGQRLLAPDSVRYHETARSFTRYWRGQLPDFSPGLTPEYLGYPLLLGALYHLTVPHPLVGVALNALCFFLMSLLAHGLAVRLGRRPAGAAFAALLVALWPPSLAYSSVLLKDSIFLLCVMAMLFLLVSLVQPLDRRDLWKAALGLAPCAWLAMNLRQDFVPLGLAAACAGALLALAEAVRRKRAAWGLVILAAWLAVAGASWLSYCYPLGPTYYQKITASKSKPQAGLKGAWPEVKAQPPVWQQASVWDVTLRLMRQTALKGWHQLWAKRWLYATVSSASLSPQDMLIITGPKSLAVLLGASLRNLFLFPDPWQRWPSSAGNDLLRLAITAQALLWYALLAAAVLGLVAALRRRLRPACLLLFWVLGIGLLLAVVVTNLGTLYRLRDLVMLPLLTVVSLRPFVWLGNWVALAGPARSATG